MDCPDVGEETNYEYIMNACSRRMIYLWSHTIASIYLNLILYPKKESN